MIPINVFDNDIAALATALGCQIASMPFTYLDLPMGTTKPRMEDLTPLMDRVDRRHLAFSSFLSYSGHLEMINSVLTQTVTYAMCSTKLPVGVIENIDRARKQCPGEVMMQQTKEVVLQLGTWSRGPSKKGGLGVLNLRLQNDALLLKQLHKFYSK